MKWYILPLIAIATACSQSESTDDSATTSMLPEDDNQEIISEDTNSNDSIYNDSIQIDSLAFEELDPPPAASELPPPVLPPIDDEDEIVKEVKVEEKKPEPITPTDKAQFPGGSSKLAEYYRKNFIYPDRAKEIGLEGKVYVKFTVNKDGSLSNIRPTKKFDKLLDDAAIEFIQKMPKWIPAEVNGKKVNDEITLPVDFKLK